jgi:hypothetical protein
LKSKRNGSALFWFGNFVCVSIVVRFYVCVGFFSLLTKETDWLGFSV